MTDPEWSTETRRRGKTDPSSIRFQRATKDQIDYYVARDVGLKFSDVVDQALEMWLEWRAKLKGDPVMDRAVLARQALLRYESHKQVRRDVSEKSKELLDDYTAAKMNKDREEMINIRETARDMIMPGITENSYKCLKSIVDDA